jgi:hypothetical protein
VNKYLSILLLGFVVSCDKGPNLAEICEQHPELCQKLSEDNHCKRERSETIIADARLLDSQSDEDRYQLLLAYEKYKACMVLAAKIEHIKLKEKKTNRVNNVIAVNKLIDDLSKQTEQSNHPKLLYYHWTRHLDETALEKFLAQEGTPALENPESQLHLATYYAKKNQRKTLQLLFHALELHQPDTTINTEIFHSLTSIFDDMKQYKQAYIWLKVLQLYHPNDNVLKNVSLPAYAKQYQLDTVFLDQVAEQTLEKIEKGQFKSPRF